ncbi:MAG TPA: substrate-binding domain-containing protein [Desulfobacteria bacterium]|nr:substrate-binding domain-containing protein [Desulfobacteria bacterium]
MKNGKSLLAIGLVIAFALTFNTGCGMVNKLTGKSKKQTGQSSAQNQKTIGIMLDPAQPETALIKKGIMDAAKREQVKVSFLSAQEQAGGAEQGQKQGQQGQKQGQEQSDGSSQGGTKSGDQATGQTESKQTASEGDTKKFAAMIVQGSATGSGAASATGSGASETGSQGDGGKQQAPVIAIGEPPSTKIDGIVAPDYLHIGELQADYLKGKLSGGNVIVLQAQGTNAEEVVAGVKSALAQSKLKVAQTFTAPTPNASPVAALDDYLKHNPGKVQAVVATDSRYALEVVEVLKKNNLTKKILVVGAGTHKEAIARIASGELSADVDKSPYLQGLYAFKLASQLAKRQTIDADRTIVTETGEVPAKLVPVRLVRPENVAQFQKVYAQAATGTEQGGQQETKQGEQGQGNNQEQGKQQAGSSGQQGQGGTAGSKVAKVRETIRTETTREMLGSDGKILGTEKQVKEETRTLPSALLEETKAKEQEDGKQGGKGDQQKDKKQSSDEKQGDQESE